MNSSIESELPSIFRCPISLEIMENPVTIVTGVTYDRRSIEEWLFTYKKTTCPATMQPLDSFDLIPNHTLKRLLISWRADCLRLQPSLSPSLTSSKQLELTSILNAMKSSPFKVSSLKKLRSFTCNNPQVFLSSEGIEMVCRVIIQSFETDSWDDFAAFRACEEALGLLNSLPFDNLKASMELLSKSDSINAMLTLLQRGSAEARLDAISILQKILKANPSISNLFYQDIDVFKALLDHLSDEVSTRLSSSSLDLLLEAVANSRPNRLKAIEAGAVSVLIELLPEGFCRHRSEKMMLMLKRLCECAEGRSAFADHRMGVATVASRMRREYDMETKLGVKVLWLVCSFRPTKEVVEEMMTFGAVRKVLELIHDGHSSTKSKVLAMVRMHGEAWKEFPCFPGEFWAVQY